MGGATLVIYVLLATFIQRISDTVRRQQRKLSDQVTRLTEVLQQNQELHERVRGRRLAPPHSTRDSCAASAPSCTMVRHRRSAWRYCALTTWPH